MRVRVSRVCGGSGLLGTGYSYPAGLWGPDLLYYMFWQIKPRFSDRHGRERGARPVTYRAPSWSWASMEGDIEWYHPDESMKWSAKVLDVHVALVDPKAPFGQVSTGFLRVSGRMQTKYRIKERQEYNMAGTEFEFPSGGALTIYRDSKCPCLEPCQVCGENITFLLLGTPAGSADRRCGVHSAEGSR
jgi:hypothetical protein